MKSFCDKMLFIGLTLDPVNLESEHFLPEVVSIKIHTGTQPIPSNDFRQGQ